MLALSTVARFTLASRANGTAPLPLPAPRPAPRAANAPTRETAFVADAGARVLFANHTARRILAAADGLAVDAGALRAALPAETARLRALIAVASSGPPVGGSLAIARPSMRRSLWLVVAPLLRPGSTPGRMPAPTQASTQAPTQAPTQAMLFVSDPEHDVLPSGDQLRLLYGLTRAEADVALLVARGEGLIAVARSLGVTRATARTHLARVFEKTGTGRQAGLVGVLLRSGLDVAG